MRTPGNRMQAAAACRAVETGQTLKLDVRQRVGWGQGIESDCSSIHPAPPPTWHC